MAAPAEPRSRVSATWSHESIIEWLLAGDPAIRWQVEDDLLDAPSDKSRAAVATEGWGRELLSNQDPSGTWAGGLYSPKWTSTTYTLLLLRRMGLPRDHPAARRGCQVLFDGVRWFDEGGMTPSPDSSIPAMCVTAMMVILGSYFRIGDPRIDRAAEWLAGPAGTPDGGWNCRTPRTGSRHGSFHTSITVLEALRDYANRSTEDAASRGRAFFLDHELYCSHRTGEPVHPSFTRFSFPPRWHFDVLRGLDYFQSVSAERAPQLERAMKLVEARRRADGRWPIQNRHPGATFFDMERGRVPSRWNTLRALRVIRWWTSSRIVKAG